ncbi:hypothetical protein SARC_03310, partial [Sphaeroforma arctica JP610]
VPLRCARDCQTFRTRWVDYNVHTLTNYYYNAKWGLKTTVPPSWPLKEAKTYRMEEKRKKGSKPVHKGDWQQYLQDIWNILERGEQEKITIDESIAFVNTQIGKMANEILDLCTVLGAHEAINHPQTEELSST